MLHNRLRAGLLVLGSVAAARAAEDNNQAEHDGDKEAAHDLGKPVLHGDIARSDLVIVAPLGAAAALVSPLVPISAGLMLPCPPILGCGVGAILADILLTILMHQLSIDTEILSELTILQLLLLLVQMRQLLVALDGSCLRT